MHDVAALAGVSHQTVSRVLNDHPSVRPETRDKVLAAVASLNYRRNSAARALVTRRTDVVGVVTPATALYGPSSTMLGIEEAARLSGLYVSVATVRNFEGETMKRILEHFFDQGVDGVAVIAPTVEIVDVLVGIRSDVPLVMVSSAGDVPPAEHLSAVGVDQRAGAVLATSHLLEHHSEILHEQVAGGDELEARHAAGVTRRRAVR